MICRKVIYSKRALSCYSRHSSCGGSSGGDGSGGVVGLLSRRGISHQRRRIGYENAVINDITRSLGGVMWKKPVLASSSSSFSSSSSSKDGTNDKEERPQEQQKEQKDTTKDIDVSNLIQPTGANPGNFLRGESPVQDPRDVQQELYWKYHHNLLKIDKDEKVQDGSGGNKKDDKVANASPNTTTSPSDTHELPPDLLKFLQDVGPLKQTLDKVQSSPRVVEQQEKQEKRDAAAKKKQADEEAISTRSTSRRRERISMPLMGNDSQYTTERNTNFARQTEKTSDNEIPKFGTTGLQLFELLAMYQKEQEKVKDTGKTIEDDVIGNIVKTFYQKKYGTSTSNGGGDQELPWSSTEQEQHLQLLKNVLKYIELPILMKDSEGNFLGIPLKDVPPPQVKAVQRVPPTKLRLVVDDWLLGRHGGQQQIDSLKRQREARKIAAAAKENKKF